MARQTIQNANASLVLNSGNLATGIVPGSSFSISFWIQPTQYGLYEEYFKAGLGTDYMVFGRDNNSRNWYIYGVVASVGAQTLTLLASNCPPQSRWTHVTFTTAVNDQKIYLNGVLTRSSTSNAMPAFATQIKLNNVGTGPKNFSNCVIGNNTVWTAAQVLALYNNGTVPTGATAVYPLSEGAGTVAYDTSGNGNNGTITSGTWTRDTPTKTRKLVNNNLVYNGDFEIAPVVNVATTTAARWIDGTAAGSTTNNIFGWGVVTKTGTAEAIFDSTSPSSGTESMKVSTTATASKIEVGSNGIDTAANNRLSCISVLPSTSYTLTFRMKTQLNSGTATGGARVGINTYTGAGTYVTTPVLTTAIKTTTDWTTYTSTFTTGATVRLLAVYLIVNGSGGTGTLIMDAWFADIQLYPTTPVTRNVATGRSIATGRSAV